MSRLDAIEILLAAVKDGALDDYAALEKELLTSLGYAHEASDDLLNLLQHHSDLH